MSDLHERIARELEHALDEFEVLDVVEIAGHGGDWDPEAAAALYRTSNGPALYLSFASDKSGDPETLLRERVAYYRELADDTEQLLRRYRELLIDAALAPVPDVPPEPGDELSAQGLVSVRPAGLPESVLTRLQDLADRHPEVEELVAFGSGNVAKDLGIPHPETMQFKWRLARYLRVAMRDRTLDATAVARLAGEIEPAQIDRITTGHVRDVDTFEIMRLLKRLGHRIIVDVLPPNDGVESVVWLTEPGGYRYDEKAVAILKGMATSKKRED
jgi:hypothetical protein